MYLEDAFEEVVNKNIPVLIYCRDAKHQESVRVLAYQLRKRKYSAQMQERLAIEKFDYEEQLYIKLYKREVSQFFTLNEDGIPVPLFNYEETDPELDRAISLMRKDGASEEEIEKFIKNWKEEEDETKEDAD